MNTCKLAYNKFDDTKKILDETDTKYNGRVQIAEPSVEAWFEMQERIAIENKATDYRGALNVT